MSKELKDIFLPLNLTKLKNITNTTSPTERPNFAINLKEWIGKLLKAVNGITFNPSTFSFGLGGEITEDINIQVKEGKTFTILGGNGVGLIQYDDGGNAIAMGSSVTGTSVTVYPDTLNLNAVNELNIISDNLGIKDSDDVHYIDFFQDNGDVVIRTPNLPIYADEAAAQTAGLATNALYKTCLLYTSPSPRDRG